VIDTPPIAMLRLRTGRKWTRFPDDVIPAWIADMDFAPAPVIAEALGDAIAAGDLGYGPLATDRGLPEAFAAWAGRRWGWSPSPEDVMLMPDVLGGIANCIEALTQPADAVLVHTPAYPPLLSAVRAAGRTLVEQPMENGRIDPDALGEALSAHSARLLLLCHPHNPTGKVYTRAELEAIAEVARRHDVIVVSDEVHADLTYAPHRHIPFATIAPDITVTLNSPSKAFNVAGLRLALCIAPAPLRARLSALPSTRWNAYSTMGVRAARAAWSDEGEAWLISCVGRLQATRDRLADILAARCPGIRYDPPQASYLAWLDCRALGLDDPAEHFLRHARVALSPGPDFGAPGAGFARLNFATSAEILDEIVARMSAALGVAPDVGA